jgi:hypothetical protein
VSITEARAMAELCAGPARTAATVSACGPARALFIAGSIWN